MVILMLIQLSLMTVFTKELKILSFHEQVKIMVLGNLPLGKLLPGKFPPRKILIQDTSHPENSHPENYHPG